MTAQIKIRLGVPEFLDWARAQPRGGYEMAQGEVVALAPARARRSLTKGAVYRALGDAVARVADILPGKSEGGDA
jgi:hypothetical protein